MSTIKIIPIIAVAGIVFTTPVRAESVRFKPAAVTPTAEIRVEIRGRCLSDACGTRQTVFWLVCPGDPIPRQSPVPGAGWTPESRPVRGSILERQFPGIQYIPPQPRVVMPPARIDGVPFCSVSSYKLMSGFCVVRKTLEKALQGCSKRGI